MRKAVLYGISILWVIIWRIGPMAIASEPILSDASIRVSFNDERDEIKGEGHLQEMPEDRYVTVGNIKTRYWRIGDQGQSLILIHGLGASAEIWEKNIEALSRNYRVYILDLPGFGCSEIPKAPFGAPDYISFMDGFLNALDIERPTLIGQSLGGAVALGYAINFPDKVDKLVLVGSAGLGKDCIWALKWMTLPLIGEMFTYPTRQSVGMFFQLAVSNQDLISKDLIDLYHRYASRPGQQSFLLQLVRSVINFHGARDEPLSFILDNLPNISQRTLIIWGGEDRVLPLSHARQAGAMMAAAEVVVMPGCGHIPFFEQAEEFNRIVQEFLSP